MAAGTNYGVQAQGFQTVAAAGTPVALVPAGSPAATNPKCLNFTVQGFKAKGTANAGDIYILDNQGNVLWTVTTGKTFSPGPPGAQGEWDLSQFKLDAATSGDGVLLTTGIFARTFCA